MTTDIRKLLEQIRGARVLVVGDVMLDEFAEGRAERISPEAPVPVMTLDSRRMMPGGAANVAANISALGARAVLIGVTGDDPAGRSLAAILENDFAIDSQILMCEGRRTTRKTRYVARQHLLRVDEEQDEPIDPRLQDDIAARAGDVMGSCSALILSDYGKGVFPDYSLSRWLIAEAKGHRIPVLVDTKDNDLEGFEGATLVKPNLAELHAMSGLPVDSDREVEIAARMVAEADGIGALVVTMGQRGAMVVTSDGAWPLEGSGRAVYDVSGAGDSFLAAMGAAMASGAPLQTSAAFACKVAGLAVGKIGTAVVTPEEILDAANQPQLYRTGDAGIEETLRVWRRQAMRIGFTNGVFDLLHVDHVDFLRRCAQRCERLVVGLNSDASVRRLKGEGRPVVPAEQRAAMLLALAWVDMVVIFDDDTPEALVRHVRPGLLLKDSGYEGREIAGAAALAEWGGELVVLDRGTRTSTTEIVGRTATEALAAECKHVEDTHGGQVSPWRYARAWLYEQVMPWWRVNAWDKMGGGFHESFNCDPGAVTWGNDGTVYKRIMVAARQTAVFSRWSAREDNNLGVMGWQYLRERALPPDDIMATGKFFEHSTGDGRTTLYDQAFVLLACAERCRIEEARPKGSKELIRLARSIVTFLDARMAAPEGYYSEYTSAGQLPRAPRHQDPHMHLLEAFIALHEATGGLEWLDRARDIVDLARKRFIVGGALYEVFDAGWVPAEDPETRTPHISPGHHFEWVWLLLQMHLLTGESEYGNLAQRLYTTAIMWLDSETGAVPYRVTPAGRVVDDRRRLWPQCEALRAHHAMASYFPSNLVIERRDELLATILCDHADGPVWHEWLAPDGTPLEPAQVPASSLYHLYFCLDAVLGDRDDV